MLQDKAVLLIAKARSRLQGKEIGLGIIAASGMVLVVAVVLSLWGLSRGSDSAPQVGTVVFEVSVPRPYPWPTQSPQPA